MASELSEAVSLPFLSVNRLATLPRIDCSSGPLNHFSSKGEGRKFLHTGCTGRIQVQREVQATVEPGSYHYQSSSAGIAGLHHSSVCSFCLPLWPTCCVSAPASLSLSAPSPALCRTVSCSTLHLLVASACLPIFFHAAKGQCMHCPHGPVVDKHAETPPHGPRPLGSRRIRPPLSISLSLSLACLGYGDRMSPGPEAYPPQLATVCLHSPFVGHDVPPNQPVRTRKEDPS